MQRSNEKELERQPDYAPGEILLGKYELVERLAVGGMGAVWRARNRLLDSEVAVKIMFRAATDPAGIALQRAHTEARLAAQLQHPAVCSALDFGISDAGDPLVVTELLHGESLDEILREQGALNAVRAAQLLLPIVDGLGAAHGKGIVHRDVKPANIFLARSEDGSEQPKLLDFGVARGLADKQRITVAGVVCGTPDYMSPEQARGSNQVDLRSDLWSVCATLYELVTNRVPFDADNYNAVMFAVSHHAHTPIHELVGEDRGLVTIIERGLIKDPDLRFQSARELGKQLAMFLLARGVEVDACGHSLRSRLSVPEIDLTDAELAFVRSSSTRDAKLAPTLPRAGVRPPRRASRHDRISTRRWGLIALGVASLFGLSAWSSRNAEQSGTARPAEADRAAPSAVLTLPVIVIEGRVGRPAGAAREALASRAASSRDGTAATNSKPTKSPRTAKPNALGYDFGL
jgi:serine/threonine-protein kinase